MSCSKAQVKEEDGIPTNDEQIELTASRVGAEEMSSSKTKVMEEDGIPTNDEPIGVSRSTRDVQPAHYLLKIESFSVLSKLGIEKYESDDFEAGGYKWRLCLYPSGSKERNGKKHISLYLAISDTSSLPQCWEVNAQFKLFVYDHIRDKYLTIQVGDGRICRFHGIKTEWGFDQLLPLNLFKKPSNGYLFRDSCVFGAEVFVIKYSGMGQCLSMLKAPKKTTYTWKIDHYSAIKEKILYSEKFNAGDLKWNLKFFPKGDEKGKGRSLSIYIGVAECATLPLKWRVYAEYKLLIRNQLDREHDEISDCDWFCDSSKCFSFSTFMLLSDLNDVSKGFLVNDTLIVEAEITIMAMTKNLA